jgi:hypothetical protein
MNTRWTKGIGLSMLGLLFVATSALASRVVIDEIRKLRASLPPNDPSRKELSLRLADRLADEVLVNPDKNTHLEMDRKEAIALYQEVVQSMNGASKAKIQFQLARLYMEKTGDASAQNSAKGLFEQVAKQSEIKELKRESTLRLAEIAELNPKNAKAAVPYYKQVLELCDGGDSCSYAHYRLAWIERNEEHYVQAVDEMKLALYDSKGQIREEALRDMIGFLGLANRADTDLPYVDQLAIKLNRPNMLQDLASAYFANGNKASGVKVLALVHSRAPTINTEVRLLEEYYGLRNWDQFRMVLGQFEGTIQETNVKTTMKDPAEIEKICRRLATQLDGERTSDKTKFEDFKNFTFAYLTLFPESVERAKIMEGYIAAEPSTDAKLAQLKAWVNDPKFKLSIDDQANFHEMRASIAQKEAPKNDKLYPVVVEEMTALLALENSSAKVKAKSRDYHYARARANYAMKNFNESTPEFESLTSLQNGAPDQLAIQSQQLLLDTYNQQKDLGKIVATAHLWTDNAALKKNPKLASEMQEMSHVADEAEFQQAIGQGQSETALTQFVNYCVAGKFTPKSCDNAKILAVNLQNYPKLLVVMEVQLKAGTVKMDELAAEYENGAYYNKAGDVLMKLQSKTPDFKEQLKIALMHELGRNLSSRDAMLKEITGEVVSGKMKLAEPEEKAFFATMRDANLLDAKLLKVASTPAAKAAFAETLEEMGRGTPETKTLLMSQYSYQGSAWSKYVLTKADALAAEVSKIKFYGKNGQVQFKKRVNRLKDFNEFADKYFSGGADLTTRVKLLGLLKQNYDEMNTEIMASPMPANLDEAQTAQVKQGLTQMAQPFGEKSTEIQALLDKEKPKAVTVEEKRLFDPSLATSSTGDLAIVSTKSSATATLDVKAYEAAVSDLHVNPKNQVALGQLKQIFASAGMSRLASYFEGRMQGMAMVGGKNP